MWLAKETKYEIVESRATELKEEHVWPGYSY